MDISQITQYIEMTLSGVDVLVAGPENNAPEISWGDVFYIYDPSRNFTVSQRFPFATIVTKNYPGFDEESQLDREGVFRLNIGISKEQFSSLFPDVNEAMSKKLFDYTELDELIRHPVYYSQNWVSVLNPTEDTFRRTIAALLQQAYEIAVSRRA